VYLYIPPSSLSHMQPWDRAWPSGDVVLYMGCTYTMGCIYIYTHIYIYIYVHTSLISSPYAAMKSCVKQWVWIWGVHIQLGVHTYIYIYMNIYLPLLIPPHTQPWDHARLIGGRGGGLGSRPKKMYGERLGDGVEYHWMKPTPRR